MGGPDKRLFARQPGPKKKKKKKKTKKSYGEKREGTLYRKERKVLSDSRRGVVAHYEKREKGKEEAGGCCVRKRLKRRVKVFRTRRGTRNKILRKKGEEETTALGEAWNFLTQKREQSEGAIKSHKRRLYCKGGGNIPVI